MKDYKTLLFNLTKDLDEVLQKAQTKSTGDNIHDVRNLSNALCSTRTLALRDGTKWSPEKWDYELNLFNIWLEELNLLLVGYTRSQARRIRVQRSEDEE